MATPHHAGRPTLWMDSRRARRGVLLATVASVFVSLVLAVQVSAAPYVVDLDPEQAEVNPGTVTLTVHVENSGAGATVRFFFRSGSANDPDSGGGADRTCVTDAAGWCSVSYVAANLGTDTICATTQPNSTKCSEPVSAPEGDDTADVVQRTVRNPPPTPTPAPPPPTPTPAPTAAPTAPPVVSTPSPTRAPTATRRVTPPESPAPTGRVEAGRATPTPDPDLVGLGVRSPEPSGLDAPLAGQPDGAKRRPSGVTGKPAESPVPERSAAPAPEASDAPTRAPRVLAATPAATDPQGAPANEPSENRPTGAMALVSPDVIVGSIAIFAAVIAVAALWAARLVFSED